MDAHVASTLITALVCWFEAGALQPQSVHHLKDPPSNAAVPQKTFSFSHTAVFQVHKHTMNAGWKSVSKSFSISTNFPTERNECQFCSEIQETAWREKSTKEEKNIPTNSLLARDVPVVLHSAYCLLMVFSTLYTWPVCMSVIEGKLTGGIFFSLEA